MSPNVIVAIVLVICLILIIVVYVLGVEVGKTTKMTGGGSALNV